MQVTIQLKHLLRILQRFGPLTIERIKGLIGYTPIKAELASPYSIPLVDLALFLGVIKKEKNIYYSLVTFESANTFLTEKEKKYLIKTIHGDEKILTKIGEFTNIDGSFQFDTESLFHRILFELGLLLESNHKFHLGSELKTTPEVTERSWKFEQSVAALEVGKFAEKIIFNLEKHKLDKFPKFRNRLVHVSLITDGAGFDIRAFDVNKKKDVFIEVKGTSFNYASFFITAKEFEVAKNMGANYKLCVVTGVNLQEGTHGKIIEIINPAKNLKKNFLLKPQLFKVSAR